MKKLTFNDETYQAQKIVKTANDIIGYNGASEQFAFRGISDFSLFQLEEGQEYDTDEMLSLQEEQASLLFESMNDKAKIKSLENDLGNALVEIMNLKMGGTA